MMPNSIVAVTPRPRPPAKTRQTSGQFKFSPPPPYALPFPINTEGLPSEASFDMILGSPISATAHLVRSLTGESPTRGSDQASLTESWINERSREELSELLVKADSVIRVREQELSLTSGLCKSLYNGNIALKSKHQALLARLPPDASMTPISSPMLSAAPTTPHYYTNSLPRAAGSKPPSGLSRHARRISMSPSDIALLSDQNAELLSKLEQLEEDSSQADHAGRRRLKKLEKEIQTLREELDASRAKSEELEQRAQADMKVEKDSEEAMQRKHERVERIKAIRKKSVGAEAVPDTVLDFAPGSVPVPPPGLPSATAKLPATPTPPPALHRAAKSTPSIGMGFPSTRPPASPSPMEYALVSQLLAKVRELEQTNMQISEQQQETANKLREAQLEASAITRLYACLGDEADTELQFVDDNDPVSQLKTSTSTVKFRSLRRSITSSFSNITVDDAFGDSIDDNMHSTVRDSMALQEVSGHRSRKSVIGFFDGASSSNTSSPALSSLDLPASAFPQPLGFQPGLRRPTLGSELGSEYDEDSAVHAENHHLRSTSLYDITQEFSPSPSPSPSPAPQLEATESLYSFPLQAPTPGESSALQLALEHASSSNSDTCLDDPDKTPNKSTYGRTQRLSQTVRSRTGRWVDRRFKDTLDALKDDGDAQPTREEDSGDADPDRTPGAIARVFDAVDAVVEKFASAVAAKTPAAEQDDEDRTLTKRDEAEGRLQMQAPAKKQRVVAAMLELWLWLQFAMIVFVFLWAMAKRGPKSVLAEANKRHKRRTSVAAGH
ncbi:hypothetical protein EWM64_g2838 [Hericium alpestre]|uniref:Uncharacterized protein n=1 Tax=Hericium alpestre TaxID=135208 RepID=A0A4Z0A413_9AGAM|nr:hypothetical protein EWM64_g2838 [Hericium alpestre]